MAELKLEDFAFMHNGVHTQAVTQEHAHLLKTIDSQSATEHVMLMIHGFSSSPAVFREIIKPIEQKGYAIHAPLLPGHGTSLDDFANTHHQEWTARVKQAFQHCQQNYAKTSVMALSLGGVLAYQLLPSASIEHYYLLAPAFSLKFPLSLATAVLKVGQLFGLKRLKAVGGNLYNKGSSELTYQQLPLTAILQLFECIKTTEIQKAPCPVDVFFGAYDKVVSNAKVRKKLKGDVTFHQLHHSAHVLPLDGDQASILATIPQA